MKNNIFQMIVKSTICAGLILPLYISGNPIANAADKAAPVKSNEISVTESIEAMLRQNHSIKALQENRSAVGHEIDRAKAGWGPRVDITARGGFGRLNNSTTRDYGYDEASPHSSASLLITQPLWDGFLTRGRVRESEATYRSLDYRVLDNATTLALDAIIAHIDVLRRAHILDLTEKHVARHKEILSKANDRASLGVDTVADVSQAQGRFIRAKSTLSDAQAQYKISQEAYYRLTMLPAVNLGPVKLPSVMYNNANEVFEDAQKTNPKISAYMEDIKAARAVKEQAASKYHPTLNIEAGPSYSDRNGKARMWTSEVDVAAVMRWNIFNSGADVAENKAAAARIRQSRQTLYDFYDSLRYTTEQSWAEYVSAREQHAFYLEAIEFNKATLSAYQEQFVLGERSLLDVLDAESELYNSSTQAATAQSNALIAAYRMRALTARLLPDFKISTEMLKTTPYDHEPIDQVKSAK